LIDENDKNFKSAPPCPGLLKCEKGCERFCTWDQDLKFVKFFLQDGVFACWKVDGRGRLQHDPLYCIEFDSKITDCICRPGPAGSGDPDLRLVGLCW